MRKSIWIFLVAILVPSLILGWLALRSAEEQKIILERRTAELYQTEADSLAAAARSVIDEQRRAFADVVRKLIAGEDPQKLANGFTKELAAAWPRKAIGFAIGANGALCSPSIRASGDNPEVKKFLLENSDFLGGNTTATVYPVPVDELNRPDQMRKSKAIQSQYAESPSQEPAPQVYTAAKRAMTRDVAKEKDLASQKAEAFNGKQMLAKGDIIQPTVPAEDKAAMQAPPPAPSRSLKTASAPMQQVLAESASAANGADPQLEAQKIAEQEARRREANVRNVSPQQVFDDVDRSPVSSLWSATTEFRALAAERDEGMVTRFVQDRLDMIFWLRPAQAPGIIFGCMIDAESLRDLWTATMPQPESRITRSTEASEFILALLDDKARPVITHPVGETGRDWKRPFVASEIGEALPHWEAALYLMRPEQLQESARGYRRTLIFLIMSSLGAIACGGWLVVFDARRQLALAQQKTDFVSNVSHELKTPLTSIRMFAELMQNGRAETAGKAPQYLRIIMVEAERLTRLINNVLDFAKLERKQKSFDKQPLDLHRVVARTWEAHELHLQESGFRTDWKAAEPPYPVVGDDDVLAQILVNLLSNAEKYSGSQKDVELHSYLDGNHVCVSVLDRGSGVPTGEERKIFEAFYRAHDSLSNGIAGSGLGLTLAQQLAREHGGEIIYQPREGGGSNFTLKLPLDRTSSDS